MAEKKIPFAVKAAGILVIAVLIIAAAAWAYITISYKTAAQVLTGIPTYTPVKFRVFGSGEDSISANFKLYDSEGSEIGAVERSWRDESLIFDFIAVKCGAGTVLFPYRIRGQNNAGAANGTNLIRYYKQNGDCVMYGQRLSEKEQNALNRLYKYAVGIVPYFPTRYGSVVSIELRNCRSGLEYHIISRNNGSLMLGTE